MTKKSVIILGMFFILLGTRQVLAENEAALPEKTADKKQINMKAVVIKKIDLPRGYHEGILLYDDRILVCNGRGLGTYIIDPLDESVTGEIEPFGTFTESLAPAGDDMFWLTDWEEKKIYKVKIEGNKISSYSEMSLAPSHPAGVIRLGEKLYVITWTRSLTGTEYHLVQLNNNGEVLQKRHLRGISEPAHIAWDGEHFWITSWYNQKVFELDINTFEIKRQFKSPAKKTTGIAWDGKHFWITGT
ncbi:MAG: hypothetical protein ABH862_03830, partial [Candidatus Omnitrophota bacterium]